MRRSFIAEHRLLCQQINPNEGFRPPEAANQPEGSFRRVQDRVDNMTPDQTEQARALMEQRQMLRDTANTTTARLPQSAGFTVQSNDYSVIISRGNDCLVFTLSGGTMDNPEFSVRQVVNGTSTTVPSVTPSGTWNAAVDSFVREVNPPPVTRPQQPSSRIDFRTDDVRPEWESDPLRAMDALSRDLRQQYSGTPGVSVSLVPTNHPAMQGRPGGEVIRISTPGGTIELKLKMYRGTDRNAFAKDYARAEVTLNGRYQREIELSLNDRGAFLGCKDYIDGVLTSNGTPPRPPLDAVPGAREPREAAPAQPSPGAEARPSQAEAAPRGPSYEMLQANVMPILQSIPGTRVDWYQSPHSTMLYVTPAGREVPIVTVEYSTNYNMYSVSVVPTADRPARMFAVGSFRASNEGWRQELKDTVISRLGPLDVPPAQPQPQPAAPSEQAPDLGSMQQLGEQVRGMFGADAAAYDIRVSAAGILVSPKNGAAELFFAATNGGFTIDITANGTKYDTSQLTDFNQAVQAFKTLTPSRQPAAAVPDRAQPQPSRQPETVAENPLTGLLNQVKAMLPSGSAYSAEIAGNKIVVTNSPTPGALAGQLIFNQAGPNQFSIQMLIGGREMDVTGITTFEQAVARFTAPPRQSNQPQPPRVPDATRPPETAPANPLNALAEQVRGLVAAYPVTFRPDVSVTANGILVRDASNGNTLTFTQAAGGAYSIELVTGGARQDVSRITTFADAVRALHGASTSRAPAEPQPPRVPDATRPPETAPANPLNALAEQVRGLVAAYPVTFRPDVSVTANGILVRDASNGNTLTFTQAAGGAYSIELVTGGARQDVSRIASFEDAIRALNQARTTPPAEPAPRPAAPEARTETFRGSGIRINADDADLEAMRNMPVLPEFKSLMLANNSRFFLRKVGGLNAVQTTYAITEESNGRDVAIAHIDARTATPPSPLVWQQELVTKLREYLRTNPTAPARPAPPPERPQPAPAPSADTLSAPERIGTITLSFGPGAREFLNAKGIIIGPLDREGVTRTCIYKRGADGQPQRMFICDDGDVGTARMTVDGGVRIDGIDAAGKATMVFIKADGTNSNVYFGQNIDRNAIRDRMYVVTPEEKAAMARPDALSGGLSAAPADLMTQYGMFMKDGKLIINPRKFVDPARPSAGLLTLGGADRGLSGVMNPDGGWDLELGNGQFSQLTWRQKTLQQVVAEMNPANGAAAITAGGWGVDGTVRNVLQYTGSDGHTGYLVFSNDPSRPRILSVCSGGSATFAMKDNLRGGGRGLMILKPVIYVYPEKTTDVEVSIGLQDAQFSALYPKMTDDKWSVTASPDGQLTDKVTGKEYSYLFWEAQAQKPFAFDDKTAHCVAGKDSEKFLEESLTTMGLNTKERNDFIVFWLPRMESSDYNLVHFITDEYVKRTPLTVTPAPDTVIRVYMVIKPVAGMQKTQPSTLLRGTRKGFTVVEWGGSKLDESPMVIE